MKDMAEAVCAVSTVKRIIQGETWLAASNLDEALRRTALSTLDMATRPIHMC